MASTTFSDIRDDFASLDDWEDRYRYIIELGRSLPPFPPEAKTDENKVRGCASQVWLTADEKVAGRERVMALRGDSDALIVKGLIAVLLSLYDGQRPADAMKIDAAGLLSELGLKEHLTPQRSNGLASMVERIRRDASALAAPAD